MKYNKLSVMSIITLMLGLVLNVQAGSQSLPIQSQDTLREYALDKVVLGYRDVYANSMIWSQDQSSWTEVNGNGAEDVLNKLFSTELQYSLSNPDDKIWGRIWLYDANDTLLFFGSAEYKAEDLGKDGPQYNIWMQRIPLLENVQSAEILALDEDGVTARQYNVDVDQFGRILFDSWMSGATNGILSVRFIDGSIVTYNLWDPMAESPDTLTETGASWKIDGHHVFALSQKDVVLVNIIEPWVLPTILIEVSEDQLVKLDVLGLVQMDGGTAFERPISVTYTKIDGQQVGKGYLLNNQPTVIQFPAAGKYRIRFEWENFGKPNTLYTGPWDGGGKG